jgi:hypothetical protein
LKATLLLRKSKEQVLKLFNINIIMPTLFYYLGLKFYFYSNDHLPVHVHVGRENVEARYQVMPDIKLIENRGLKPRELRVAELAIEENREIIIERWTECFKNKNNGN